MIKNVRIKLLAILPLLIFSFYSNAQEISRFTVAQAIDYAMEHSKAVANAMIDIKIQEQTNREVTAQAFPQIDGSLVLNDFLELPTNLIPSEFTGGAPGTYIPIQFGTKYNATGGIDVNQIIFDGQVFVGLQARKAAIKFYEKQSESMKELIKKNVYKIYYQLVVGEDLLETVDANILRFEQLLKDTREIYKNGFAEKLDVDKVSVQLNNLYTEKVKVKSRLDAGNVSLKFLLNMPQKDSLILTDTLSEEVLKRDIVELAYRYEDRKDYQVLEVSKQLHAYNVKRYKALYLPVLSGFASYSKNAQRSKFDYFNGGSWYTTSLIGFRLDIPIFDGLAKSARLNKAKLELQKTNNNIEQLKSSIDNEVGQSRFEFTSALITVDNQKQNMELAEEVYNTTKLKYEQGLGSQQEIYNAQTELRTAQSNYYGALSDAVIAKIDFLSATGKL